DRLVISQLSLGSLMEQDLGIPLITVEAGGSKDPSSIDVARKGLENYFLIDDLFKKNSSITVLQNPLRLELKKGHRIIYDDNLLEDCDVTIRKDIEKFNFSMVDNKNMLGRIRNGLDCFQIGKDVRSHKVDDYFFERDGGLYPKCKMHLFMATVRPDIAVSDCLFYFIVE
ncbi:MAG: hypothetical protein OXB84_08765, partial [Halobacteriovoraceae bacterium]|nr:hypothetical protein [Halobacteriovoraceae bacterium]